MKVNFYEMSKEYTRLEMANSDDIGEGLNIFKISDELNFRRLK
jgi:hypothetical protein